MTREEILRRLTSTEDAFTERKPGGVNAAELRQTLVAFANSVPEGRSAVLFIGVADDGTPTGVADPDRLQQTIRRQAQEVCYPAIPYQAEVLDVDGASAIAVVVEASVDRPHFSGPAFVRTGSENVRASPQVYEDLIASRNDKAGKILRHKGKIITVHARNELGSTKRPRDPYARFGYECRVEACNAHTVHLHILGSGGNASVPLSRVTINYDDAKHRLLLEVDAP